MVGLPAPTTTFVGRGEELAHIGRHLESSRRLIMLIGPGGVGKTRLALEVARRKKRAFPDGAHLIALGTLTDARLVGRAVVDALNIPSAGDIPAVDLIREELRSKRMLLVFDNCEHVEQECAVLVAALLAAAPGLRILATSRRELQVDAEQLVLVSPLPTPDVDRPSEALLPDDLPDVMALFTHRAAAVKPGFSINDQNYATVADICVRLDCLPLAVEMAAVRHRALSLDEILDQLASDRFGLLSRGSRAAEPRQQTLWSVFDWSYGLCSEEERDLWARLSVFCGEIDLAAAQNIAMDGNTPETVRELVASLVSQSILIPRPDVRGHTQYSMLKTIRQYGEAQLRESGAYAAVRARFVDHFRSLVSEAARDCASPREEEWLTRIDADWPNLRAVLDYCAGHAEFAWTGLEIAVNLTRTRVWFRRSLAEGRYVLRRAIESCPREPSELLVTAVASELWLAQCHRDQARVEILLPECRELASALDEESPALWWAEGAIAMMAGRFGDAIPLLARARDMYRARLGYEGDWLQKSLYHVIASAYHIPPGQAIEVTARYFDDVQERGASWALSWARWPLGIAYMRSGAVDVARRLWSQSMQEMAAVGDYWGVSSMVESLAWADVVEEDTERAVTLIGASASIKRFADQEATTPPSSSAARVFAERRIPPSYDPDEFKKAFARGAELSPAEAMDFALRREPSVEDETPAEPVAGTSPLTPRQREVADLVARGLSNQEIADHLVVSIRTVHKHVTDIFSQLDLHNRAQLTAWVMDRETP